MTADTPRGLQPFQPAPKSTATLGKPFAGTERALSATPPSKASLNLEIRRNYYDQSGKDLTAGAKAKDNSEEGGANGASATESATKAIEELAKEPKKAFHCYSCGIDCTRVRFHYAKSASSSAGATATAAKVKYDLCPNCFMEGRYPSSHAAVEFVKLEDSNYSSVPDRDAPWTDAELLLLLEGLELFDENWSSVADHVGTRTREECVMKFLQLEIEDKYLEDGANGSTSYGALNHGRVPFTQADNPVMSVVSFLAGMSEPSVTAAAAGKSVDEMRRGLRSRLENGTATGEDKGKDKEALKSEDSMEVDTAPSPQPDSNNQVAISETQQRQHSASLPSVALATAAARAAALASHEEREMTSLVASAVNTTLQKFELKLQQFSEMEAVLQAERRELERGRQQLFLDRLAFKKRVREVQEGLRLASVRGGEDGARMAQEVVRSVGVGEKLGFRSVHGRVEEDVKPLSAGNGDFRSYEM